MVLAEASPEASVSMRMTRPFLEKTRSWQREPQLTAQPLQVMTSMSAAALATAGVCLTVYALVVARSAGRR